MDEIYSLIVEEARQSFFQMENLISAIDNKTFGIVALDTILLSIFGYISTIAKYHLFYASLILLTASLVLLLVCIWPRRTHRQTSEKIIELYGTWDCEDAATQLAINYASSEKELYEIYDNKFKYLQYGLLFTILSVISALGVFIYSIFYP